MVNPKELNLTQPAIDFIRSEISDAIKESTPMLVEQVRSSFKSDFEALHAAVRAIQASVSKEPPPTVLQSAILKEGGSNEASGSKGKQHEEEPENLVSFYLATYDHPGTYHPNGGRGRGRGAGNRAAYTPPPPRRGTYTPPPQYDEEETEYDNPLRNYDGNRQ